MQVTEDMVRVAAEAMFAKRTELIHAPLARIYDDLARSALTAAFAAMWQDIGGDPYKLPQDGVYLALSDKGHVCPVEARGGYRLMRSMPGFIEWDPRTSIIAFMPLPPAPTQLSTRMGSDPHETR